MLGPVQVVNVVTKAEALAGIWHRTTPDSLGGDVYRQYTADGTYRMGRSPEELETQPLVEGEFWFEGNQVLMRDAAALPSYGSCLQPEQVGRYAVERLVNGHIRFVEVEDECRDRARMLGTGEMEPVVNSPKGRFAAKDGDWVLTFDDDGRFTFSESGVVAASGTFSIQGNELTWETDSYCGNAALMKATYTWTFENDTLLFQLKGKDNCADRLAVLDNIPYHVSLEPTAMPSAQNAATAVAEAGDTAWDMVVLGDSLVADDYSVLPEAYAARIEEDLGVEVEIQNLAVGGETSQSLLTNVQKYPWYREPLQEAEVVLISVGGGDLPRMEKRFFGGDDCGGADNQDCLREQLEESQAEWDALLAEIVLLTKPGKTLIRPIIPGILEYYARVYKDQPEEVEAYNSYVVALYEHMARSCAERGIPVLDLYALYDGPNADPGIPEIAGTGDGVHVSDEGDAVIADLLQDLGYGFAKP
jgi:lysophospholipase L1-like esterase